jgi:hypothetical protein
MSAEPWVTIVLGHRGRSRAVLRVLRASCRLRPCWILPCLRTAECPRARSLARNGTTDEHGWSATSGPRAGREALPVAPASVFIRGAIPCFDQEADADVSRCATPTPNLGPLRGPSLKATGRGEFRRELLSSTVCNDQQPTSWRRRSSADVAGRSGRRSTRRSRQSRSGRRGWLRPGGAWRRTPTGCAPVGCSRWGPSRILSGGMTWRATGDDASPRAPRWILLACGARKNRGGGSVGAGGLPSPATLRVSTFPRKAGEVKKGGAS